MYERERKVYYISISVLLLLYSYVLVWGGRGGREATAHARTMTTGESVSRGVGVGRACFAK